MANTKKYLNHLLQNTDITPACSEEERSAADIIARIFTNHGFTPEMQEFSASGSAKVVQAGLGIVAFLGAVLMGLGGVVGVIGLLLALAAAVIFTLERTGRPVLSQMGRGGLSQNVIAYHKASGPLASPRNRPVVVVAHYDSPRVDLMCKEPLASYRPLLVKLLPYAMLVPAVLAVIHLFPVPGAAKVILWVLAIIASLIPLVNGVAIIANRFVLPYTSGAVCNKSSVAAMLGVMDAVAPFQGHDEFPGDVPFDKYYTEQRRAAEEAAAAALRAQQPVVEPQPENGDAPLITKGVPVMDEGAIDGVPAAGDQSVAEDDGASSVSPDFNTVPAVDDAAAPVPAGETAAMTLDDLAAAGLDTSSIEWRSEPDASVVPTAEDEVSSEEAQDEAFARETEDDAEAALEAAIDAGQVTGVNAEGNVRFGTEAIRSLGMLPTGCVLVYDGGSDADENGEEPTAFEAPHAEAAYVGVSYEPYDDNNTYEQMPATSEVEESPADASSYTEEPAETYEEDQPQDSEYETDDVAAEDAFAADAVEPAPDTYVYDDAVATDTEVAEDDTADDVDEYVEPAVEADAAYDEDVPTEETAYVDSDYDESAEDSGTDGYGAAGPDAFEYVPDDNSVDVAAEEELVPSGDEEYGDEVEYAPSETYDNGTYIEEAEWEPIEDDETTEQVPVGTADVEAGNQPQDDMPVVDGAMPNATDEAVAEDEAPEPIADDEAEDALEVTAESFADEFQLDFASEDADDFVFQQQDDVPVESDAVDDVPADEDADEDVVEDEEPVADESGASDAVYEEPTLFDELPEQPFETEDSAEADAPALFDDSIESLGSPAPVRSYTEPSEMHFGDTQLFPVQPGEADDPSHTISMPAPAPAETVDSLMAQINSSVPAPKPVAMPRPRRAINIPSTADAPTPHTPETANRNSLFDLPNPAESSDPFGATSSPASRPVASSQARQGGSRVDRAVKAPSASVAAPDVHARIDTINATPSGSAAEKSRHGLGRLFGRKKKQDDSMSDWLGVDEGFDAKKNGGDIGSWDHFEDDNTSWKGGAVGTEDMTEEELRAAITSMGDDELLGHDIWFVATGASENGNAGIKAFLDSHRDKLRGVFLINLESVGAGQVAMLATEGERRVLKGDKRIMKLVSRVSADFHNEYGAVDMPYVTTDAHTAMSMSLRSLTIAGIEGTGFALSHTEEDQPYNIDPDNVALVSDVVTEVIRRS